MIYFCFGVTISPEMKPCSHHRIFAMLDFAEPLEPIKGSNIGWTRNSSPRLSGSFLSSVSILAMFLGLSLGLRCAFVRCSNPIALIQK